MRKVNEVEELYLNGKRYIVSRNPKQARKDAQHFKAIIESLEGKSKTDPKSLIGNKGYCIGHRIDP